jgi:predicted nucleic acid-binding Zn finger protein
MKVQSSNKQTFYEVSLENNTCTCPDYIYRQKAKSGKCKHIKALVEAQS